MTYLQEPDLYKVFSSENCKDIKISELSNVYWVIYSTNIQADFPYCATRGNFPFNKNK